MTQTKKQLQNTIKQLKANKANKQRKSRRADVGAPSAKTTSSNVPAGRGNTVAGSPAKIRFSGSERLGTVAASNANGNFKTETFIINPRTFEWLGKMATLYDKYRFHKLAVRYVTSCGTDVAGEVNLSFDFDPNDPAPQNILQCCNMAVYKSTSAFKNCTLSIPVKSPSNFIWRYCKDANGHDDRIVDTGNLFVSTLSFGSATAPGALYVDYDVEFADKNF